MEIQSRYNVIGCQINNLSKQQALENIVERLRTGQGGYVCFTNVHVSVMARENSDIQTIINNSFMSLPDGKPLYWVGKARGLDNIEHIPGPDFFPYLLDSRSEPPLKHYFFGSKPETLEMLIENVKSKYPDAEIVGSESPPFRDLAPEEVEAQLARIRESGADIVWIGLGAPKQEKWMSDHWQTLAPAILFGVGAAFDFHAGNIQRAPDWAQRHGLEWLHRLLSEPRRLWKRYFYTNTMFMLYLICDSLFSARNR